MSEWLAPAERLRRARAAQVDWGARSVKARARALRGLRRALVRRMDELVAVMGEEIGKPPLDAVAGDLMVALEQMRYYEGHAGRLLRSRRVGQPPFFYSGARFVEHREPFGVVLVLAPWNYPVQLALVPAATALIAGNAVVLKCSEKVPRTSATIAAVCREAALPEGLLDVSWEEPAAAAALVDAGPDMVFFTGSTEGGRAVAERAAAQLIPSVLELGGKDAAIVFESAQLARTARGLAYGSFSNAGQVCVSTRRIFVEQSVAPRFLETFAAEVRGLRQGTSSASDLGPVRVSGVEERLRGQIEDALERGARAVVGWPANTGELGPVVLTEVPKDARLLHEEAFGPIVSVETFRSELEAIELANSSPWALSASVWTGDKRQGERVARALASGTCAVNDVIRNIGNPQASFGGNGASGWGRYHGAEGLRAFTRTKTVMSTGQSRAREVHWFPARPRMVSMLAALVRFRHGSGAVGKRLAGLMRSASAVALLCAASAAWAQRGTGDLTVNVKLPPGAHGSLAYLVFSSPAGFPDARDHALKHAFVPVSGTNEQAIDVGQLPAGQYAVTVYLDANGNGKLDKGFLGIPKEPVGASNNPKGRMGPPSYKDCAFEHGASAQTIQVTLVH